MSCNAAYQSINQLYFSHQGSSSNFTTMYASVVGPRYSCPSVRISV